MDDKLDQFIVKSGCLSLRGPGPLDMHGSHRNHRSKRLKTMCFPERYSIGRMYAPLSIFVFFANSRVFAGRVVV
jgi:hypothetical protein